MSTFLGISGPDYGAHTERIFQQLVSNIIIFSYSQNTQRAMLIIQE